MQLPDLTRLTGTASFVIVKERKDSTFDVFHARPGSNAREAWENATDTARETKKTFVAAGWKCRRIWVIA